MGGWAVAQSPILVTTITLNRLCKRGYEAMLTLYTKIAPHLNEPLYTRTVRTACREVLPARFSGGAAYSITNRTLLSCKLIVIN